MTPFKVRNINNYYFRDHPVELNPDTPKYKKYWYEFAVNAVKGKWIYDDDTWVWMGGKSLFHHNYLVIRDENRRYIHPAYRDLDRILARYTECVDGFSGFAGDEKYTCHELVKKAQTKTLEDFELKRISKYCYIPGTTEFKEYVHPWTYLMRTYLIDDNRGIPLGDALWENQRKNAMILGGRFTSKDQPLDTILHGECGKLTMGEVKVGDRIYGPSGDLATVIKTTDFTENLQYEITFSDGRKTRCGEGHLWEIFDKRGKKSGKARVVELSWLKDNYKGYKRPNGKHDSKYYIKYTKPLKFREKPLPIDPYFLGLWLGDGSTDVTAVTTMDTPIADYIYKYASSLGLKVRKTTKAGNKASTYYISNGKAFAGGNKLRNIFKELSLLGNKHIPEIYKRASEDQRVELLRGFMDADGTIDKRQGDCSFVQKNKNLTEDFCDILGSLGINYKSSTRAVEGLNGKKWSTPKIYHHVSIKTKKNIFRLERKAKYIKDNESDAFISTSSSFCAIVDIKPLGEMPSRCVSLDSEDQLYLCDDYIVTHNSTWCFVGDFLHEWFFGGAKTEEELKKYTQDGLNFGMASTDSANLNRSAGLIATTMTKLPGSYRYVGDDKRPRYNGPYYKNYTGGWKVGSTVRHEEKFKNGSIRHTGSTIQVRVVTPDKTKIFTGDRFRRIYFEEAGFIERMMEIHANQVDTLQLYNRRVGSEFLLGTNGEIEAFRQINSIFNKPKTYDFQDIPNYWGAEGTSIGLFIPAYYTRRDYVNENEDVDLLRSFNSVMEERAEKRLNGSSMALDKLVMFHPVDPKEMMRPSGDSVLPKQEAQEALNNLEINKDFEKRAMVGWLEYNQSYPNGVQFTLDIDKERTPITTFDTNNISSTEGAFIQYEIPTPNAPKDLYWVLYDPAAQSGEGTSYHSVLVYKYSFVGNENTLEDTIVAEWLGRLPTLELNWSHVVKIARYFNAKIFPEYNTPGFLDWCKDRKLMNLLQPENINLKRELNPKAKTSAWKKGFRMDTRAKGWALNQLRDWLLEVKEYDEDGVPLVRVIDTIYSQRLLEEIVNFDPNTGNYDHISSALGLMMLQNALRNLSPPAIEDKYAMDEYLYPAKDIVQYETPYTRKVKSRLNNSKFLNF